MNWMFIARRELARVGSESQPTLMPFAPVHRAREVLEDHPPSDKPTPLPVRQRWRSASHMSRPADVARLSCPHRFLLVPDALGGEIHAACERSLAQGRAVVEAATAPDAVPAFGAIHAHTFVDAISAQVKEPWMFVHISAPQQHWRWLDQELRARGALLHEVEMQAARVVLRAEGALPRLLGFAEQATSKADGHVHVSMWLLRYRQATSLARSAALASLEQDRP